MKRTNKPTLAPTKKPTRKPTNKPLICWISSGIVAVLGGLMPLKPVTALSPVQKTDMSESTKYSVGGPRNLLGLFQAQTDFKSALL